MTIDELTQAPSWFADIPVPMWCYDVDTLRIVEVNDAAVEMYGWSREEFARLTLADIRPTDDLAAMRAVVDHHAQDGFRNSGMWRHLTKAGELRYVNITGQRCAGDSNLRVVAIVDVTSRVIAQRSATTLASLGRLGNETPMDQFLPEAARELAAATDSRAAGIAVVDPELRSVSILCRTGGVLGDDSLDAAVEAIALLIARGEKPLLLNDTTGVPADLVESFPALRRVALVPVERNGRVAAVAAVANKDGTYTREDVMTMRVVTDLVLHVVEREQARAKLQSALAARDRALDGMIHALAKVTELRDPYTAGHQMRVADLAVEIGRRMGLDEHRLHGLHLAASVHDIGKIAVPAEILVKPSRLTSYERESVRQHVAAGWEILAPLQFPWPVAEIVRAHHERLDGSGYPDGLRGDDIPMEARIIAVADVVESMASHRPYRAAPGLDRAVDELRSNRDVLFDGEVLDAFEAVLADPPASLAWLRRRRHPAWAGVIDLDD